jgi:hypothetical protein
MSQPHGPPRPVTGIVLLYVPWVRVKTLRQMNKHLWIDRLCTPVREGATPLLEAQNRDCLSSQKLSRRVFFSLKTASDWPLTEALFTTDRGTSVPSRIWASYRFGSQSAYVTLCGVAALRLCPPPPPSAKGIQLLTDLKLMGGHVGFAEET